MSSKIGTVTFCGSGEGSLTPRRQSTALVHLLIAELKKYSKLAYYMLGTTVNAVSSFRVVVTLE